MVSRIALALLILLAGCAAITPGPPERAPGTDSPPTTTSSPDESATPSDATGANTIAYAELSPVERRAFEAAVAGGAGFFEDTRYVEGDYFDPTVADAFEHHEYVRRNETYYRLSGSQGPLVASYSIQATEKRPPDDAVVVSLSYYDDRTRDPVRWAIENGSYSVPPGKWSSQPASLDHDEYVRTGNATYRLSVIHGDYWVPTWEAEPVE